VNAVFLLVGLLVLSSLGGLLMTRRSGGGAGLPSGVEYAALGFVLGPQVLGLVGARDLAAFEPVVQVAIGWLAFAVGLDYGFSDDRRVRAGSLALGSFSALVTGGGVAAATWFVTEARHTGMALGDRVLLCGGLGVACSETTRYAVRWVADRYRVRGGPLARSFNELAHADSLVPLVAVAVLLALDPSRDVVVPMPLWQWPAITIGLAVVLGAGAALLLRSEMAIEDTWGILFGVCLLTIGVAARLALSTLTATFFMGITVSGLSRHRHELRAMVAPTERPVLLPALLLAGARLDFRATPALPWIAAAAIAARFGGKILVGWVLLAGSAPARKVGVSVGISLMSSGALAICVALAFALRFPGTVGDTILVVAVLSAIVGELVGPARLRRSLAAAGEIEDAAVRTPAPHPVQT
jgi:Kef-type K+ transport system membrane component KefB